MEDTQADSRGETLQVLETFIQTQKELLARQRDDIDRLQRLRRDISQNPAPVLDNLSTELDHGAFRLSCQPELRLVLPESIDWTIFNDSDPAPLRTLRTSTLTTLSARSTPHTTQQSGLSELQTLVKRARKTMIDPVLAMVSKSPLFLMTFDDSDASDDEGGKGVNGKDTADPLEWKRSQEREKIKELKRRMVRGGTLSLRLSSLTTATTDPDVVFVRDDVEDETGEVDIGDDGDEVPTPLGASNGEALNEEDDTVASEPPVVQVAASKTNGRTRKPSIKVRTRAPYEEDVGRPRKKVRLKTKATEENELLDDNSELHVVPSSTKSKHTSTHASTSKAATSKSKSSTFNLPWSSSEQALLETLLESIPQGEKNRWQKISIAMGGRRTPRQVASRVQKWFEKLKVWGVPIGGGV